ncbi:MAG: matrixin family metalloprotease [Microcoleus sp. PH2017_22_RUC_O_B]|uniref:matrixin family metalloprotease n=1 Tax=unclassified Microcoleus TaxID=2642155 RepID=UPI001DF17FE7|nr:MULTISPECIES: matrixin family metalloprotease [unclassified Microcoleus]MCC3529259.1 matrixin family metalloprotease [Microcoleus sp. PH2017_21_RUC_O_A]MCC3541491.1 matrixin family metalloprotease [Microcoleus sp. PH2017_22_RUC_O_B]
MSNFFTPEFNDESAIAPWNTSLEATPGIIPKLDANRTLAGGVGQEVNIPTLTPESYDNIILPDASPTLMASALTTDSNTSLQDSSVDLLTGQAMSEVYEDLSKFAAEPDFVTKMNVAFGENWDAAGAKALAEGWFNGDFSAIPSVKVVSSAEIGGANGAFAAATDTIYLSKEFWAQNGANPAAVADVLLEEIGHSVDSRLNVTDSPGDEGAIFAAVVQGKTFDATDLASLKAEDDSATIHLNGKELQVEKASLPDPGLRTVAHIQDVGDRTFSEGAVAGTTGQSRRLEGFQINLDSPIPGLSMEYMAHVQDSGDTSWVREGQYVGTKGKSKRIEGFAIRLTGSQASKYDVFYQAHVEGIGNTPRVGNGQFSGTRGQSKRVEAISVWVQPKPQPSNPDIDIQLSYPKGGFSPSEMNQMEKAAQNWERIITKDKDSSGVLKISVLKEVPSVSTYWAQTIQDIGVNYRKNQSQNYSLKNIDIMGVDYGNEIRFNPNTFSTVLQQNSLVRLAMHEIGHTLGLDHETVESLMNHNRFNTKMTNSMYNTLTAQGYGVDRTVPINWS